MEITHKKYLSSKAFPQQISASSVFKSSDFRSSMNLNSVKHLSNPISAKLSPGQPFFSPKVTNELRHSINLQLNQDQLPKKINEPQMYFISKNKLMKSEDKNVFKGVLSEIYNKEAFIEGKKPVIEKQNEVKQEINSEIKDENFKNGKIELVYKNNVFSIVIDNPNEKKVGWLKLKLINLITKYEKEELQNPKFEAEINMISGFVTVGGFLIIDFILTLDEWNLLFVMNKKVSLTPVYRINLVQNISNKRLSLRNYELVKVIGSGGFSQVILGRKIDTGKLYALKIVKRDFIRKNEKESIIMNEINILKSCNNPYIVHLDCAFKTKKYLVFVMDFCAGGEFFYLLKKFKRVKEEEARIYFLELCLGIDYLHKRNIIYRDIKPENILLDLDGHLKIADFGLAKPGMDESILAYSFCGSPEYMAPEMLKKNGHNFCVDIYCLGAFLYELVVGIPPFYSTNTKEMFRYILSQNIVFPDKINLSPEIKNLMRGLLEKNPERRIGFENGVSEILNHPWCRKTNINQIINKQITPPFKPNPFEFYFDEVSNQELLEELEQDDDRYVLEIFDHEDIDNQLDSFHYIASEEKKKENLQNIKIIEKNDDNNINHLNFLKKNNKTPSTTKNSINSKAIDYKSVSSSNFDEILLNFAKKIKNVNVNKNEISQQIPKKLISNDLKKEEPKKLVQNNSKAHFENKSISSNIKTTLPSSTKNTSSKHFLFESHEEKPIRTFNNLEDSNLQKNHNKIKSQTEKLSMNFKTATDKFGGETGSKNKNKLLQEIHAAINKNTVKTTYIKTKIGEKNMSEIPVGVSLNLSEENNQQNFMRHMHLGSFQNLHEVPKKKDKEFNQNDGKKRIVSNSRKNTEH